MTQLPTRSTTCETKSSDRHTHLARRQTVWKWPEMSFSPEVKSQAHTLLSLPTLGGKNGIQPCSENNSVAIIWYILSPCKLHQRPHPYTSHEAKNCLGVKFTNLRDHMLRRHKVAISGLSYWHEPLTEASSCAHQGWMTGSCMGCRCMWEQAELGLTISKGLRGGCVHTTLAVVCGGRSAQMLRFKYLKKRKMSVVLCAYHCTSSILHKNSRSSHLRSCNHEMFLHEKVY